MSKRSFAIAAIVAAATVGDGVFALPYVFYAAGWLLTIIYLLVLSSVVIMAHEAYLATLEKVGERERLLGLARRYFGSSGFWIGFLAIVVGLILTLVAYLILGTQFIHLALPLVRERYDFAIFWAVISLPIFLADRRVVELEMVGIICTMAFILLIFITALPHVTFASAPAFNWANAFLPFGAVLFSLAGWTSIEPIYEARKEIQEGTGKRLGISSGVWKALAGGTLLAGLLYTMFSAGILGSSSVITPDTASGLISWPFWKREALAIMGLIAVATVYLPISHEIKNSLENDLKWSKTVSRSTIVLAPLLLILMGFDNFIVVIGIVGGLFLSTQYILMIAVGRRALALSPPRRFFMDIAAVLFAAASVYSIYVFIVR